MKRTILGSAGVAVIIGALAVTLGRGGATVHADDQFAPTKDPFVNRYVNELKKRDKEFVELRKKYPFESVSGLLEYEAERVKKRGPIQPKLSGDTTKQFEQFEGMAASEGWHSRKQSLELLHSQEVGKFLERENFGRLRRPGPSLDYVELEPVSPVPFASGTLAPEDVGTFVSLPAKNADVAGGRRLPSIEALSQFHLSGQLNFVNANSVGLVRDREHVAGFLPHQFRSLPELVDAEQLKRVPRGVDKAPAEQPKEPGERWLVRRLELVSLLRHEEPVAYLAERLPSMKELRGSKTRALTPQEKQSLKLLEDGENLVIASTTNRIVMLGAIRAGRSCQQCHHTERGALLGSFTYELHRDPPVKDK